MMNVGFISCGKNVKTGGVILIDVPSLHKQRRDLFLVHVESLISMQEGHASVCAVCPQHTAFLLAFSCLDLKKVIKTTTMRVYAKCRFGS
jgi:hypothetical protein